MTLWGGSRKKVSELGIHIALNGLTIVRKPKLTPPPFWGPISNRLRDIRVQKSGKTSPFSRSPIYGTRSLTYT